MIIDVGRLRIGVSVVRGGIVRFTSTIDMGSDSFTRALMTGFGISEEDAEHMKNERALMGGGDDFFDILRPSIERLSDEVAKLYEYWHTYHAGRTGETPVQHIIVSGGGANLLGLAEYLSAKIHVPASVGNPWKNVNDFNQYIPPIPLKKALGYATVIGLALPSGDTCI
jgi:type IV pilus assembly protein PilM